VKGERGIEGKQGKRGERGKAGPRIIEGRAIGESLILVLEDASTVEIDCKDFVKEIALYVGKALRGDAS
jgi:hypothetical protein